MAIFMVESNLPELTPEFIQAIPRQRRVVNRLFTEGHLLMYAVDEGRAKWWCTIKAENDFEVLEILSQFPLTQFITPQIFPLMFYNGIEQVLPGISLN